MTFALSIHSDLGVFVFHFLSDRLVGFHLQVFFVCCVWGFMTTYIREPEPCFFASDFLLAFVGVMADLMKQL